MFNWRIVTPSVPSTVKSALASTPKPKVPPTEPSSTISLVRPSVPGVPLYDASFVQLLASFQELLPSQFVQCQVVDGQARNSSSSSHGLNERAFRRGGQ